MANCYAGIGSRETPENTLFMMQLIAGFLDSKGFLLRSGGAKGADTAFETGAVAKTVFYAKHWIHNGVRHGPPEKNRNIYFESYWSLAYSITCKYYHSDLTKRPQYVRDLMTRNVFQVLGYDLNTHSDFVIC